jgi:hypothetical protein
LERRLASQRITIAKLGGVSGDVVLRRLAEWSAARQADDPELWSPDQWPAEVRCEADDFAERLRTHGLVLPVVHFVEWADMWSMGNLFPRWLTPPDCPAPTGVHANRFEIFAYSLPDEGRLREYLASAAPQQWAETDFFVQRLREAVEAWNAFVDRAALVVLRFVVGGSALDEEVTASLQSCPAWLSL